jgi:hypothetical protein
MDILAAANMENRHSSKKHKNLQTRWLQIQSTSNISDLLLQALRLKIFVYFMQGKERQKEQSL